MWKKLHITHVSLATNSHFQRSILTAQLSRAFHYPGVCDHLQGPIDMMQLIYTNSYTIVLLMYVLSSQRDTILTLDSLANVAKRTECSNELIGYSKMNNRIV